MEGRGGRKGKFLLPFRNALKKMSFIGRANKKKCWDYSYLIGCYTNNEHLNLYSTLYLKKLLFSQRFLCLVEKTLYSKDKKGLQFEISRFKNISSG